MNYSITEGLITISTILFFDIIFNSMDSFIILNYINNLFWNDIIFGNNFLELKERIKQIQQQISGLNSV